MSKIQSKQIRSTGPIPKHCKKHSGSSVGCGTQTERLRLLIVYQMQVSHKERRPSLRDAGRTGASDPAPCQLLRLWSSASHYCARGKSVSPRPSKTGPKNPTLEHSSTAQFMTHNAGTAHSLTHWATSISQLGPSFAQRTTTLYYQLLKFLHTAKVKMNSL